MKKAIFINICLVTNNYLILFDKTAIIILFI